MLDIKFIREHPEEVKKALATRGADIDVAALLAADEARRAAVKETDDLRAKQNALSTEIAKTKAAEERKTKLEESKLLKSHLQDSEARLKKADETFWALMKPLPNIPLEETPVGKDETGNVVLREVGAKRDFGFTPKDYMQIAAGLDLIDTERAAHVSGSRFGYLKREAALLEMALVRFAFEHLGANGFIPVVPPVLIKEEMMRGMGYIDSAEDREERYALEKDGLFLVGTSEQSVGPMHADETFKESDLPLRYAAFSTCFRREAGSYGKDTQGILRVHQFDKVEMFTYSKPEHSKEEHALMLRMEEELMAKLNLPYRVLALCTGDISRPSAGTYDIETWLPGQNGGKGQYRETHSTSNTTGFQARRLNVKYKTGDGKTEFVHMLNGTAFAIGRMLIAILENYQNEDGTVDIPEALQPFMGGLKKIERK